MVEKFEKKFLGTWWVKLTIDCGTKVCCLISKLNSKTDICQYLASNTYLNLIKPTFTVWVEPRWDATSGFEPGPDLQQDGASPSRLQRTLIFHYCADLAKHFGLHSTLTSKHCCPRFVHFRFVDYLDGEAASSCVCRTCVIFSMLASYIYIHTAIAVL